LLHQEARATKWKKKPAPSGGRGLLATWSVVYHNVVDDSARLHTDSESELGCCKVLGANGGSETITNANDYCIHKYACM